VFVQLWNPRQDQSANLQTPLGTGQDLPRQEKDGYQNIAAIM
jgi:hypothetical protein